MASLTWARRVEVRQVIGELMPGELKLGERKLGEH